MNQQKTRYSYRNLFKFITATIIAASLAQPVVAAKGGGGGGGPKSDRPSDITVAGDSITMGFAADCTGNVWLWDLACLLGGDQPEHSWFDGSSSNVNSVLDRYKNLSRKIDGNKNAAASGSEMRGSSNNLATQASNIVAQSPVPDHVEILLGGNDICNRGCTDPNNCSDPLYTETQWRDSVRAGLDILVSGLPTGSTVQLNGMPRVQDLRQAGLDKQSGNGSINCESVWSTYDICRIVTNGGNLNGESFATRLAVIEATQQRYNEILSEEAIAYNANSTGQNPNGIEVVSEYVDENTASGGTFQFGQNDIDGGDCFHPSVAAQDKIADFAWAGNTDK